MREYLSPRSLDQDVSQLCDLSMLPNFNTGRKFSDIP
ncbi:MAG: hypothetical protein RJA81_688 [Planctomycetota bacterium]